MALEQALAAMTERAKAAEASAAVLREALCYVEWQGHEHYEYGGGHISACPACKAPALHRTHEPCCPLDYALATDAGAKMLAEVKRLREFVAAVREAMNTAGAVDEDSTYCVQARDVALALVALDAGEVTG
jgi:hypothetical protein